MIPNATTNEGNFALNIGYRGQGVLRGALCGRIGYRRPSQAWWVRNDDDRTGEYIPSRDWLVRWSIGAVYARGWNDDPPEFLVASQEDDPDYLPPSSGAIFIVNGSIIMAFGRSGMSAYMVWGRDNGLRPLIRDNIADNGAAAMGYDGQQLVWTSGVGRPPGYTVAQMYAHDKYYLMTAPFSTDAATLAATSRVVAEEVAGSIYDFERRWRAACGYAAHLNYNSQLTVHRLSDGATWVVPKLPNPVFWSEVVGVTCTEILASAYVVFPEQELLRIPITSLGEPIFPSSSE